GPHSFGIRSNRGKRIDPPYSFGGKRIDPRHRPKTLAGPGGSSSGGLLGPLRSYGSSRSTPGGPENCLGEARSLRAVPGAVHAGPALEAVSDLLGIEIDQDVMETITEIVEQRLAAAADQEAANVYEVLEAIDAAAIVKDATAVIFVDEVQEVAEWSKEGDAVQD